MKKTRKVLSITLVLCAILTLIPVSASAATDSRVEKAISWAISIANDNSHGYSMKNRYGPDYDCSSFVSAAFKYGGFNVSSNLWTGNMERAFTSVGFKSYAANSVKLQRGDILLRHDNVQQHVELYLGNNQCVAAHWDDDGRTGDSGGHEIEVRSKAYCDFCNYKQYTRVLRYEGSPSGASTLAIKNCNAPSSLSVGQYFDLTGEITSNYPLSSVRGYIQNVKTGKLESDYTMKLSGKSFSVLGSQLDYHLYCNKLPVNNTFVIHYTARDVSGKQVDWQSAPFTVKAKASRISGVYVIESALGGVLDIAKGSNEQSAKLLLWSRHDGDNQRVHVIPCDDGTYVLQMVHSNLVLDVEKANVKPGAQVIQYGYHGAANQRWKIVPAGDGYYYIISALNEMALDVSGGHGNAGDSIIVYHAHYKDNQKWKLVSVG